MSFEYSVSQLTNNRFVLTHELPPRLRCNARLDPEGVLASVPCILTTWLGLHFGLVLVHHSHPGYRLKHW